MRELTLRELVLEEYNRLLASEGSDVRVVAEHEVWERPTSKPALSIATREGKVVRLRREDEHE